MSAISHFFDAFGFHTQKVYGMPCGHMNTFTAVGYIPIAGIVVGALRFTAAVTSPNIPLYFRLGLAVRAIFEILGLGLVVGLLVDLPVTIVRHINCGRGAVIPNQVPRPTNRI